MARNRKSQSASLMLRPALKAAVICGFILVCCVGYVWQKKQIDELSQQIKNRENQLARIRDNNGKLKKQIAVLLGPKSLEARAKELNLGLVLPQQSQVWRLTAPPAETPAGSRTEQRYAAGGNGAPALP
jgi:hypothetical protein